MFSSSNYIFLLKKKSTLSYLIFFTFLNKKHWIFFLLTAFFHFFNSILSLYISDSKKAFNYLSFLKLVKNWINFKVITKLHKRLFFFYTSSYIKIYFYLKKLFYFYKVFVLNIHTSFFFNTFDSVSYLHFNINSFNKKSVSLNKFKNMYSFIINKLFFYFVYKKSKLNFFYNYSYFDSFIYDFSYNSLLSKESYKCFISSLLKNTTNCISRSSFSNYFNNSLNKNVYYVKHMITYLKRSKHYFSFFQDLFTLKKFWTFLFYNNSFLINYFFKRNNKFSTFRTNKYFFFILNYQIKDCSFLTYSLDINTNYLILSLKKHKTKKEHNIEPTNLLLYKNTKTFFMYNVINFFIYKKIYYIIRNKKLFNNINWYKLCNFYYNKIILLQNLIFLQFLNISLKSLDNSSFKYLLVYKELNFFNILKKTKKSSYDKFNPIMKSLKKTINNSVEYSDFFRLRFRSHFFDGSVNSTGTFYTRKMKLK